MDEYAPQFQAKVFAEGRATTYVPTELFKNLIPFSGRMFLIANPEKGQVIADYWPGYALMLTPFIMLGVPWLLNPLLCAGSVLLLWHLARRLFPATDAPGWVVLFAVASANFTANGMSFYAMPAHVFFNLLYVALLLRQTTGRLLLAGLVGSYAMILHNPLPHLAFGAPWVLWLLTREGGVKKFAVIIAGYLPLVVFGCIGWFLLRIDTLHLPSEAAVTAQTAATGYTFSSVFKKLSDATFTLPSLHTFSLRMLAAAKMWVWCVPGLLLCAWYGYRKHSTVFPHNLFLASAAMTFLAYMFITFSQGHGWGYRYFFTSWGVVPLLAAAAMVGEGVEESFRRFMANSAVLSLVVLTVLHFAQINNFIDHHLSQRPESVANTEQRQLMLIDIGTGFYTPDLVQNDPFLRGKVIYLAAPGKVYQAKLMEKYFPAAVKTKEEEFGSVWLLPPGDYPLLDYPAEKCGIGGE